jgi:hypothetical protein
MLVRFIKGPLAARADTLVCIRDDHSRTEGQMPRQGILPHDAIHFVVEKTLGLQKAFFGHVARGLTLDHLALKQSGERPPWARLPQALQAESLVECLQAEQWGGTVDEATFQGTLGVACRVRGVPVPHVTPADLVKLRVALREFGAAWRPLKPGEMLERRW